MWASVRVLLWKNWRVKQRESRLNRGRPGGSAWLFPALVTDIVLPLALVLLLIRKICVYNAQLATPSTASVLGGGGISSDGLATIDLRRALLSLPDARRQLVWESSLIQPIAVDTESVSVWGRRPVEKKPAALLLTALPLLLQESNQSLAIIDRQETRDFIAFLDRYDAASTHYADSPTRRSLTLFLVFQRQGVPGGE